MAALNFITIMTSRQYPHQKSRDSLVGEWLRCQTGVADPEKKPILSQTVGTCGVKLLWNERRSWHTLGHAASTDSGVRSGVMPGS